MCIWIAAYKESTNLVPIENLREYREILTTFITFVLVWNLLQNCPILNNRILLLAFFYRTKLLFCDSPFKQRCLSLVSLSFNFPWPRMSNSYVIARHRFTMLCIIWKKANGKRRNSPKQELDNNMSLALLHSKLDQRSNDNRKNVYNTINDNHLSSARVVGFSKEIDKSYA